MIEAFCRVIWRMARDGGKRFFWRVLAFSLIVMLLFSLLVLLLFLSILDLSLEEHWDALIAFALIAVGSGVLFSLIFRRLVSRAMLRALAKYEGVRSGELHQMGALAAEMDYRALEDKLMRALNERRGDQVSRERAHLLALARYPWYMAPMQEDRVLADENAAPMRGRAKESVLVLLSLPGASALALDPEKARVLLRKALARALAFARGSGMLLTQFSLEASVLVADIPYAAGKSLRARLPSLCRKWREQIHETLASLDETGSRKARKEAMKIVPACFLHFGEVGYGRMQSGARGAFLVDPQSWQGLASAARARPAEGEYVSERYAGYAGIDCGDPGAAESASPEWYLLK